MRGTIGENRYHLGRLFESEIVRFSYLTTLHVAELPNRTRVVEPARGGTAFLELMKLRITFFVGMSVLFGIVLSSGAVSFTSAVAAFGIFLLASGSAALNHYQEREADSLMHRTKNRPLPSGRISPQAALCFVVLLSLVGSTLVYVSGNLAALIISWLAFIWYNGFYTPMKKWTAFAVIPGSLIGALPVMSGWVIGGGNLLDPRLIVIALFFFVWQAPHFWLLMMVYSSDYERGGFPTLHRYFRGSALALFIYFWIVALVFSSILLLTAEIVQSLVTGSVLIVLGMWLVVGTWQIISHRSEKRVYRAAFMKINIYVLMVSIAVFVERVLR
ncbi:MAG: protoheme IX farnesyltransferase [Bacteroidota bacterium]